MYKIYEDDVSKSMASEECNYLFNKKNGHTLTWGKTPEDDAIWNKYGPFLADIEITTICGRGCSFCYKSNTESGTWMRFETFKTIFNKLPDTLTQIAFGVDEKCESNPDVWDIMHYCRDNGIIPNVTVANITPKTADKLVEVCGAVAVSRYANEDDCYNSVKLLTDRGLEQTNIHLMLSHQTGVSAFQTLTSMRKDKRLRKLNAIVFLSLKRKGRAGENYHRISPEGFEDLIQTCLERKIPFGFDSCSATKFMRYIGDKVRYQEDYVVDRNSPNYKEFEKFVEPCESSLFSVYIDVHGNYYPCSFCEGQGAWRQGVSVLECDDFIEDIWMNEKTKDFRAELIDNYRECIMFTI